MVFWRKKKNIVEQEQEDLDQELLHPENEPEIEPSTDYEASLAADDDIQAELHVKDNDVIDELVVTPLPDSIPEIAKEMTEEPDVDHTLEGGWFSRMSKGLSKSSSKITQGLSDIITKSKLDQDALDRLEDVLIEADLGPKTAARLIETFSKDRFGKDISEDEIKEALAENIADILEPVAQPLTIEKPEKGPYVILVCGVNGAGKTTTIGKYTQQLQRDEGKSVMIAAADTFRAAAIEQLSVWAKRSGAVMFSKDVGSDAASVAYEAYEAAVKQNIDVLLIDTAGRLQNKSNLMAELEKIIRVLKKQNENVPHATLLVLDSTTGQNAYSQVQTFKQMVDVTGLIVTKLDGSAKGGVLIGLADQFGVPVHAIGVGESIDDLKAFTARDYARSLMGLES
ncbi:MAG: signal recognition particle-docking protein FtsY [Alphaproteobacteria bacterium]|nr:MAG: signal recognition particle-docking protein FtsY [Alphaproteobacteria bacterium]